MSSRVWIGVAMSGVGVVAWCAWAGQPEVAPKPGDVPPVTPAPEEKPEKAEPPKAEPPKTEPTPQPAGESKPPVPALPTTEPPKGDAKSAAKEDPKPPIPPAPPAEPPETEILFKDGRRMTGLLVSQDEKAVVLLIEGIETPIPRGDLERVRVLPSVEDRYRALRATVDEMDLGGRVQLAQWLLGRRKYELALAEIGGVLAIDPAHAEAAELRTLIEQQQMLAKKAGTGRAAEGKGTLRGSEPKVKFPLLTDEQINVIRVYELDLAKPPRITIPRAAIDTILERYAGQDLVPTTREGRDAFHRKPAEEIVGVLFRLRARDLYGQVKVHDHPEAIKQFRDNVHRQWLLNACATDACHGGAEAGRLYLATKQGGGDRLMYTNFLILERFRLANGKPLIDYTEPARSPLLQMALPRDLGLFKHPEVEVGTPKQRWRPVFRSQDDPRFVQAVAWINAMFKPRPEYPVEYTAPMGGRGGDGEKDEKGKPPPR